MNNKKADVFYKYILEYAPEFKNYFAYIKNSNEEVVGFQIEVPNILIDKIFQISYSTICDEITIGHDIYDHEHFCLEMDGEEYLIKALKFIKKIYNIDLNRRFLKN